MTTNVSKTVMRRVYYTYALNLVLHPAALHGAFLALCVVLLSQFVSFYNVFLNILDVRVGEVHEYILGAFFYTELWTVVLFGLVFLNLSILAMRAVRPHRHVAVA